MAVINPKQLKVSEPHSVKSMLEKSLKLGEGWVVSKMYDSDKGAWFYLLPGLYIRNLSEANLTDETAGKLDNGLNSGSIQYVVYPNDRRSGFIPIVFNRDTQFYFEEQLSELLRSNEINWYIFKVPVDVDADNNERIGSEMIKDVKNDNEPIVVDYGDIETTLRKYGRVDEDKRDEMFDSSIEEKERKEKELEKAAANEKKDHVEIEQNVNKQAADERIENIQQNVDLDEPEQKEEENNDDDIIDSNLEDTPPELDNNDTLAGLFDGQDVITPEVNEAIETENVGSLDMFDEPEDNDEIIFEDDSNKEEQSKGISKDESYEQYKNHPEELQKVLDRIRLPRFEPFVGEHLSDETREQMNHYIDNINNNIQSLENNIKDKTIALYENDMTNSYETVKDHLDPEKGDDFVRERYQTIQKQIEDYHEKARQESEKYQQQLEDDFYGPQYEAYKAEILASLPQKFKDEFYGERVVLPSEDFKDKQKEEAENKEREVRNEFDDWRSNLESTAITTDQERAINHIKTNANSDIEDAMNQINTYRQELEKQKHTLMSHDLAQKSADAFRKDLEKEAVQQVIKRIEEQYGPDIAQQAKENAEIKQKLREEREKNESLSEQTKHERQLEQEKLERERRQIQDEKERLERQRRDFEEKQRQISQNQQAVVYPSQQPVIQQAPQPTENNGEQQGEKLKGVGDKKLTTGKKVAAGSIGGLMILGIGAFAGYEVYDMGSHDYAGKEEQLQKQEQHQTKEANISKQSSDDTPYLGDGNVSIPKDNYAKGDKLEYEDKKYDVEDVSKNVLKVKGPNGDEFQVPIKNK